MKQILITFSFIVGFLIGTSAQAAWGPGGCVAVATPVYEWRYVSPIEAALYRNGVQIRNFNYTTRVYRDLHSDGTWGPEVREACKCDPCKCDPCECGAKEFFGVDSTKLHKDGVTRHYINGKQVPRREALAAIQLTDDSAKPFVTFIGDGRKALAQAFLATPEAPKCRVNSFAADAWECRPGFVTSGHPTVYVQNPKGEVLYRNVDGKAPSLDTLVTEVRKAQPDYDPAKDLPSTPDFDFKPYLPYLPYVGVGVGILLLLLKRKS